MDRTTIDNYMDELFAWQQALEDDALLMAQREEIALTRPDLLAEADEHIAALRSS